MDWIAKDEHWKQVSVRMREKWRAVTDDDLQFLDRNKDALVAKVFERTGLARDTAERQVDALLATLAPAAALEKEADETIRFPPESGPPVVPMVTNVAPVPPAVARPI